MKRYKQTRVFREGIFSRSAIQTVLSTVSAEKFTKYFQLEMPEHKFSYGEVHCSHTSIHIAGSSFYLVYNYNSPLLSTQKTMKSLY